MNCTQPLKRPVFPSRTCAQHVPNWKKSCSSSCRRISGQTPLERLDSVRILEVVGDMRHEESLLLSHMYAGICGKDELGVFPGNLN